jgi:Rps23 Pro-64 3,4-dihydroxylase Tpa1-like proline 4-hydroxylase
MESKELAPGIVVYSNVLNDGVNLPSMIEEAVEYKAVAWLSASVSGGTNKDVRDTDTMVIPSYMPETPQESPRDFFNKSMLDIINSIFKPAVNEYMANYGISYQEFETFSILKYGVGQKFTNHIDDHPNYHRRVSMVYYMNEDYQGGEISFPRFDLTYKPKADELLLFPSGYTYNHSVSPVSSGVRYAIVGWIK